ncbi:MAG: zinc metallopeptidase, partial [Woeseiaceae bacterium]
MLSLVVLAIVFGPGLWVQRVLARYSEPADRYRMSGGALARQLLDRHGLQAVGVEPADQGDHYDPQAKKVRLTPDKYHG